MSSKLFWLDAQAATADLLREMASSTAWTNRPAQPSSSIVGFFSCELTCTRTVSKSSPLCDWLSGKKEISSSKSMSSSLMSATEMSPDIATLMLLVNAEQELADMNIDGKWTSCFRTGASWGTRTSRVRSRQTHQAHANYANCSTADLLPGLTSPLSETCHLVRVCSGDRNRALRIELQACSNSGDHSRNGKCRSLHSRLPCRPPVDLKHEPEVDRRSRGTSVGQSEAGKKESTVLQKTN